MNRFQTNKSIPFDIKDLDTVGRRVKFAASRFGNMDSDGDVITPGAFAKSIAERGPESQGNRKIKFLRYHDFEHEIGKIISLEETPNHLVVTADLGRSSKGDDAFLDYQDGIITEHSIGFLLVQDKIDFTDDGIRLLKEVMLMETSAVTFGANAETPTFSISKGNSKDVLEKLNKEMDGYLNALKNGKGTDERLESIELNLRVCQLKWNNIVNSLNKDEPVLPLVPEPDAQREFYLKQISKLN